MPRPKPAPVAMARKVAARAARESAAPTAWATNPVVLIRRNPKAQ